MPSQTTLKQFCAQIQAIGGNARHKTIVGISGHDFDTNATIKRHTSNEAARHTSERLSTLRAIDAL
jgi:hypothetical protein